MADPSSSTHTSPILSSTMQPERKSDEDFFTETTQLTSESSLMTSLPPGTTAEEANAQYLAAKALLNKSNTTKNIDHSVMELLLNAARQGHVEAQFELARLYAKDRGGHRNMGKSDAWLEKAASSGHAHAMYKLARRLIHRVDRRCRSRGMELLELSSAMGHGKAKYLLAIQYERLTKTFGHDLNIIMRLYGEAVESGFVQGYEGLGLVYRNLSRHDIKSMPIMLTYDPTAILGRINRDESYMHAKATEYTELSLACFQCAAANGSGFGAYRIARFFFDLRDVHRLASQVSFDWFVRAQQLGYGKAAKYESYLDSKYIDAKETKPRSAAPVTGNRRASVEVIHRQDPATVQSGDIFYSFESTQSQNSWAQCCQKYPQLAFYHVERLLRAYQKPPEIKHSGLLSGISPISMEHLAEDIQVAEILSNPNRNDPVLFRRIGQKLVHAKGVKRDIEMGISLLLSAAVRGDYEAMFILGQYQYQYQSSRNHNSSSRPRDKVSSEKGGTSSNALYWLKKAAKEGRQQDALCFLGALYTAKPSNSSYWNKGIRFFDKAKAQGSANAAYQWARALEKKSSRISNEAFLLYQEAGEKDHPDACWKLSKWFWSRVPWHQDARHHYWKRKAAALDNRDAIVSLARDYEEGRSVKSYIRLSIAKWKTAAEKQSFTASVKLANMYMHGDNVPYDCFNAANMLFLSLNSHEGNDYATAEVVFEM